MITEVYSHSIYFEPSKCTGEMACLKVCPVEAIRIKNNKAKMLDDRCIDCGECFKVCKSGAIVPLTNSFNDFSKFKYTVAIPSLAIYSQFGINVKPKAILQALKTVGFDEVIDITRACISVARALDSYLNNYTGKKPLLSSFCPTCVKLIQMKYPELLNSLIPIISPMELAAMDIRKKISARTGFNADEIGIIYITPCPSKMIMIMQKNGRYAEYDGALPISDLYNSLFAVINRYDKKNEPDVEHFGIEGFGLNYVRMGGLISMLEGENSIAVAGIPDVVYILEEIEKEKLKHIDFVELHSCPEGCIGGSMVVDNVYLARTKLIHMIRQIGSKKPGIGWKDEYADKNVFHPNFYLPLFPKPIDIDIKKAIGKISERQDYLAKLPNINCGACGSPSCKAFAEDIVQEEASLNDCLFLHNDELKKKLKEKMTELLGLQKKIERYEIN